MLALVTWLLAAAPCPSAHAVVERVGRLGVRAEGWEVTFTAQGEDTILQASHGEATVTRALPGGAPCEALEEAAAVILASVAASVPEQTVQPRRPLALPSHPGPPVALEAPPRLTLGLGPSLTMSQAAPGLGGILFAQLRAPASPFGLSLTATGAAPRTLAFAGGELQWGRLSAGLGPELSLDRGPAVVAFWVHLAGGALWLSARGYAQDWDRTAWDLGVRGGSRVEMLAAGPLGLFVGLSGTGWLRWHRARLADAADAAQLPWFEIDLTAGVLWRG